jgi:hypothetical protein
MSKYLSPACGQAKAAANNSGEQSRTACGDWQRMQHGLSQRVGRTSLDVVQAEMHAANTLPNAYDGSRCFQLLMMPATSWQ